MERTKTIEITTIVETKSYIKTTIIKMEVNKHVQHLSSPLGRTVVVIDGNVCLYNPLEDE